MSAATTNAPRRVFTSASLFLGVASPIWGAMYAIFGEPWSGAIPSVYAAITLASFVALHRWGGWHWFRVSQLVLIFVLPVALMLSLGGFIPGSAVVLWAVLAPLGSLWGGRSREAIGWISAFVLAVVISGVLDRYLRDSNDLPDALITTMFVMNIVFVCGAILLLLDFYVRQKDHVLAVMRRNRDLEEAYLAQEITLRQSDKLATLGKLSAGMAHELNNPASAAQQATRQLSELLLNDKEIQGALAQLDLNHSETEILDNYSDGFRAAVSRPTFDPLERSDNESAIQDFLEEIGVDEAWELSPSLVSLGLDVNDLRGIANGVRADRFAGIVRALDGHYKRESLLGGLDESTGRIIELVRALKSYTYLDQAPRQFVDIHDGIDSTLMMLQNRLKTGIRVDRSYADDLPQIEAYGGELNQVWTNILDNAIHALNGEGAIEVTTSLQDDAIVVEIHDDGPGIPAEVAGKIFDPFVTTKAPGEGTGLGLNISHNIVTQKHGGEIAVSSSPGNTTFTVSLPLVPPDRDAPDAAPAEHERADHDLGRSD